ncbi:MAG TPA: Rrf2 family transcriptional regulator [Candidatus Avacidaminococcus intestinavium]|uniref:Rrf2 family transcriptional regulator n=1 Tax=Candidatus Avacidaminococcus intestinavium TaxID=2840684 RepID=A0A9D1MQ23_9FIRM|nr:Rrf2 family transcriptional regulator [Candidatus Avacidaminococcus intestinavium]
MKISTKGRYALRLMLDLAVNYTGEYITIKSIAKRQEISEKYLEQIITQLSKAGFVRSARGAQGGYMLTRKPQDYTIGDILRVMEGNLSPVACLEEDHNLCNRTNECVTLEVWLKLEQAINNVVDNITLADLVERHQEKSAFTYEI